MGHFETQTRLSSDGLHRIAHPLRYLDQEALGRHEGLLTFDGEADLAAPHHPEDAVIAPVHGRALVAGLGLNPFDVIARRQDHLFAPTLIALVLGKHRGKARHRLVLAIGHQLVGLGRPGIPGIFCQRRRGQRHNQRCGKAERAFPHHRHQIFSPGRPHIRRRVLITRAG